MSGEFSNNLPPSSKPYYFTYLKGYDWYKAQLLELTGFTPKSPSALTQQSQNTQPANPAPQQTYAENNPKNESTRIKIDGEITKVDPKTKSFSIQTDQGSLTFKIPHNPLPPEGLRIEIDIPRLKEGQQIAFRPLPENKQSPSFKNKFRKLRRLQ